MKIYIIMKGDYSDYHICGVSLDRAEAEKIAELVSDVWGEGMVEEFDTDAYSPVLKGGKPYIVWLSKDGEITLAEEDDIDIGLRNNNKVGHTAFGGYYVNVVAKDEDHARQIGADILFQYKYEKETYGRTIYDEQ